jgi:hypothetical protein
MMAALAFLHWLAGLVVLAEALNKLERTAPLAPGLSPRARAVVWCKVLAWCLLAVGAGGALVTPMLHLEAATLQDPAVLGGFALLIVRSRFKESIPTPAEPSAQVLAMVRAELQRTRAHLTPMEGAAADVVSDLRTDATTTPPATTERQQP